LKEGDANSKFFHGIMSSRKRSNALISLNVNGVSIEGVIEVRNTVFQHFKNYFQRSSLFRPNIGRLVCSIRSLLRRGLISLNPLC